MSGPRPTNDASHASSRRVVPASVVVIAVACGIWWAANRGAPVTSVSGEVTSGGRPVVFGTVTIVGADRRAYSATIGADGRFTVANVPVGPVQIAVSSPDPRGGVGALARGSSEEPASPLRPTAADPAGTARSDAAAPPPGTTIAAAPAAPMPDQTRSPPPVGWFRIPGRYASPDTSGLGATVAPGGNRLDLRVD